MAHQTARDYWRNTCRLEHREFEKLLAPEMEDLHPSDYSKLTNSGKCSKRLMRTLSNPVVLQRIERALDCPGLFRCTSPDQVKELFYGRAYPPSSTALEPSDCLLQPAADASQAPLLSVREERVVKQLLSICLQDGEHQIVCWADPPPLGGSWLAYALASTYLPRRGVTNAFLVQPDFGPLADYLAGSDRPDLSHDDGSLFDQAILQVAKSLGIPYRPGAPELLHALRESRSVLLVLQANLVPETELGRAASSLIGALLNEARRGEGQRPAGVPASIILIGQPRGELVSERSKWLTDTRGTLPFQVRLGQELHAYFERHLQRFTALRSPASVASDSIERLKRARQSVGRNDEVSIWPSTVRLLAFLASNRANLSCFDPTAGWRYLAGMDPAELPMDIRLHLAEVIGHAAQVRQDGKRNLTSRALRWCSTAVHWLTEDAVLHLGSRLNQRMEPQTFRKALNPLNSIIQKLPSGGGGSHDYKADLALRAMVQDRWASQDALERARAHHAIADRLMQFSDDKELLPVEYPMRPHWGRSRMHFLAECLRHLVRSCEHAPRDTVRPTSPARSASHVPTPPAQGKGWRPGYAREVLDFCFVHIFWQQLNANKTSGKVHNRKLARQHGDYYLTAELLQLMSEGGELGEPHWALDPAHKGRYLREVAYAQLDLGDLAGADATFQKLIDHWHAEDGDLANGIDFYLDRVVARTALNDLEHASRTLALARDTFASLPPVDGDPVERRNRLTTKTRLDARDAQLKYLQGDLHGALQVLERIRDENASAIVRDVAHIYIATLGALGGRERLNKAAALSVQNAFDNTSRGLHHAGLGFRVSLGHVFRKLDMLDAAEVTLDQVYRDVQLYGCSERTYMAMLLEAGRVVLSQGRPARAYAAYLRPCLDRARSFGLHRNAQAALIYARRCIDMLLSVPEQDAPDAKRLKFELKGRGDVDVDFFPMEHWLNRLGSRQQLLAERAALG